MDAEDKKSDDKKVLKFDKAFYFGGAGKCATVTVPALIKNLNRLTYGDVAHIEVNLDSPDVIVIRVVKGGVPLDKKG